MSPWRVALFSLLGMTAAAGTVYTLTPPPQAVASSSLEPPAAEEPLDLPLASPSSTAPFVLTEEPPPVFPNVRPSTLPTTTPARRPTAPDQAPTFATPPQAQQPQQFATPPEPPGILQIVSASVFCDFSVDGAFVSNGLSVRFPIATGQHTVTCKPLGEPAKVVSVFVKSNETAMAFFKF